MRRTILLFLLCGFVSFLFAAPAYLLRSRASGPYKVTGISGSLTDCLTNVPPVAVDDNFTVHGFLTMDVMRNDYDPNNNGPVFDSLLPQPLHGTLA